MLIRKRKLHQKKLGFVLSLIAICLAIQMLTLPEAIGQTSTESDFITLINAERATLGKNTINFNFYLSNAAYLHSKDMAEQNYFNHTSLDGRTFDQRISAAGYANYTSLAENIAYASGAPDAARVYGMWKNSPGHYANIIGEFTDAGLGIYSKNGVTYYTLDLGQNRLASSTQIPEIRFSTATLLFLAFASVQAVMFVKKKQT